MINITIFSKNRAMQLEACLRSMSIQFKEYIDERIKKTIIYSSEGKYSDGYELLRKQYQDWNFVEERNFRQDTLDSIDVKNQFTMFLVDDIIFKAPFSICNDPIFGMLNGNMHMLAISLRLHKNINYCYAIDKDISAPKFNKDLKDQLCVWQWPGAEGDWGYGYSLDGNIFNTKYILSFIQTINFANPNQLEAALNSNYNQLHPLYMCCYESNSRLFNVPANRVQHQFENRVENSYSAEELNDLFLSGKRINIDAYMDLRNYSVHYPVNFEFKMI